MSCSLSLEIRSSLYSNPTFILKFLQIGKPWLKLRRRMLYPAELCRHTIFGLKSRFFSLFDHPDRWPIFSIFSRYFFRRKCYLRPLQHLAFLIKILSTELPSTPEYFSKVLSTGPPLGGGRSILLSYRNLYKNSLYDCFYLMKFYLHLYQTH